MQRLLVGVSTVYHLACLGVRHSIHSPARNHEVNATGTLTLLEASRRVGIKRFVYVSSSEVYGTARWIPMNEEHPTYPATIYGSSKLAGECYTRAFHRTYGFPTVVVRPFNAYGPRCHHEGDSGEVIAKFLLRSLAGLPMIIFGDGSQTRDFTFVTDTAKAIRAAGESDQTVGETINVGSGMEIRIDDLAEEIAKVVGIPKVVEHIEGRPGDVLRLYSDSTRAREALGFHPTVTLKDGLARLCAWYRQQSQSPEQMLQAEVVRSWEPSASRSTKSYL